MKAKFLVSWVEEPEFVRGQTCQTRDDMDRLYDHVKSQSTTRYVEVRRIGDKLRHWSRPENALETARRVPPHSQGNNERTTKAMGESSEFGTTEDRRTTRH